MAYKLRAVLRGHDSDVRAVSQSLFPEGAVLTASRDKTCRLWAPNDSGGFSETRIFSGHTRYISSVCTIPPSAKHPQGLVATGGNDNLILIYSLESTDCQTKRQSTIIVKKKRNSLSNATPDMIDLLYKLEGHTGTVCSLAAGNFGTLMSGSWDKTARVWINDKSVMELKGHEASVWAVQMMPDQGLMLTGSADKSIKLWKANNCERTFHGHTDCVRGLAIFSSLEFLSCSNDGTIRRWSLGGECLQVYSGHTSFIYSVSNIPSTDGSRRSFATSGEDRTVKIWSEEKCEQSITLPCQSAWSVASLFNGDLIVGTSDGVARVFTKAEERVGCEELIKEFEEEVANQAIPAAANMDLGDIKVDQLPGPEALLRPGDRDGQTKLIKKFGLIEAHQWDEGGQRWQKVGEVVGAAGQEGTSRKAGKNVFEGKEYDYVFDVDIQEGQPPLKLPYNVTDDPWVTAHHFLQRNELSPLFLDQVANFIIKNTEGVTLGSQGNTYSDPFTGGSRYVPSTGSGVDGGANGAAERGDPFTGGSRYLPGATTAAANGVPQTNSDPFTGGSSYVSMSQAKKIVDESKLPESSYFPKKSFIFFESGKVSAIVGKIKELNNDLDDNKVLSNEELGLLEEILQKSYSSSVKDESLPSQALPILDKVLGWPLDKVYPGLDSLRLLISSKDALEHFIGQNRDEKFLDYLSEVSRKEAPAANGMLTCRTLCNCFRHSTGVDFVSRNKSKITEHAVTVSEVGNKNAGSAAATLLLNLAVMCVNGGSFEDRASLLFTTSQILMKTTEAESQFRLLVSIGTLISNDDDSLSLCKSLELDDRLQELSKVREPAKVGEVATQLAVVLRS